MRRMQQNGRSQAMMGFTALGGTFALATLAVAGPVVEVGVVGQGGNPDHQEDQGEGVEDQPGDGDRQHL